MDDKRIIELYWARNESALVQTRAKYSRYCYHIAYNILQDHEESEEVENDTYLDAWNSIPPHRPENFQAFLAKITRRIALDKYRARIAQKRGGGDTPLSLEELHECIPSHVNIDEALEAHRLADLINGFLHTLPKTERAIFIYRYWYCESTAYISSQFCCTQSKVRTTLHRTRLKLKEYLKKEEIIV
jgi:RNA polymerase sigma-70 factor (ECF subfamily)